MPINYDVETDYLYQKGIEKGIERGMEKGIEKGMAIQRQKDISIIENLLLESALPAKKIAAFVGYTEDFVAEIEARLIKEGKLKSDNKRK